MLRRAPILRSLTRANQPLFAIKQTPIRAKIHTTRESLVQGIVNKLAQAKCNEQKNEKLIDSLERLKKEIYSCRTDIEIKNALSRSVTGQQYFLNDFKPSSLVAPKR